MEQMGIQGLSYYKFDLSLCTYCSEITRTVLYAIAKAWKGKPWPDVEVLSGKMMEPRPGKKKTILFGKCMYQAHKNHPNIQEMIPVKGCPPKPESIIKALHQAGIDADPSIFKNIDKMPAKFLKRYENKPEFDNRFFRAE
jgi:Ni,Fe-hydrogenase III small subunit